MSENTMQTKSGKIDLTPLFQQMENEDAQAEVDYQRILKEDKGKTYINGNY